MKARLPAMLGIFIAVLGGTGCADILGADFDNLHPRKSLESDARADGTEGVNTPWPDARIGSRPDNGDAAPDADAPAWSDVTDMGNGFTPRDVIDAGHARDAGDSEDTGRASDASDAADAGHPPDGADPDPDDARDGGNPDSDDARDGGNLDPRDARDGGNLDDVGPTGGGADVGDADAAPPPDGPRTTGVIGGFVSLGVPTKGPSTIDLRGQVISNAAVRGVTSSGISIEGRIQ